MAIPTDTVWEVQTSGADTNGGGFSAANQGATGVDMTYGVGAAVVTCSASLSATGTTALADSGNQFANTQLGNIINIATKGSYCIVGYTDAGHVTVDRALGTFSGATGKIGGALASPGAAGIAATAGNVIHVKAGTYSITSATANVAGGCLSMAAQAANANAGRLIGYQTTRGDGGTKPLLQASGISTFTLVTVGTGNSVENISVDGALLTSSRGIAASNGIAVNCKAANCTNTGFTGGALSGCEATGCSGVSGAIASAVMAFRCTSHANVSSCPGFANVGTAIGCIAYANAGAGFTDGGGTTRVVSCTSYGNTGAGFVFSAGTGTAASRAENLVSYGNTSVGIAGGANVGTQINAVFLGANSAATSGSANITNIVTLGADPFTNAAGGDFSLNATAGGGAAVRGAGTPGAFPGTATTGYLDGGAVQHQDAGGGGLAANPLAGFIQ